MSLREKLQMKLDHLNKKYERLEAGVKSFYELTEHAAKARDKAELRVKRLEDAIRDAVAHPHVDSTVFLAAALKDSDRDPAARIPVVISKEKIKVAILCSGPSLNETWPNADQDKYHTVIAVNHALLSNDADWLCAMDLGIDEFSSEYRGRRPKVGWATGSLLVLDKILRGYCDRPGEKLWTELQSLAMQEFSQMLVSVLNSNKSGPNSLYLARYLNAASVDVFGCDLVGDKDCNGWSDATHHNDERWKQEGKLWMEAVLDLRQHMKIHFYTPENIK